MIGTYGSVPIFTDTDNQSYWLDQSLDASTSVIIAVPTLGFSRLQIVWDRTTPVGTREDVVTTGLSWCEAAASACTPLSPTDKTYVETLLATWWTAQKAVTTNQFTLREYRWYDYQPISTRPGPVDKVTASGVVGGLAASRLPDQLAYTSTYKTASRKHWGRSYWPFSGTSSIDLTYGRVTTAATDTLAANLIALLRAPGGSGIINPCVASIAHHGVLLLKELQVDNVADVIRSRRAKVANYRKSYTT